MRGRRAWRFPVVIAAAAILLTGNRVSPAPGVDESPAPILQWFESSYRTVEARMADVFVAGSSIFHPADSDYSRPIAALRAAALTESA